MPEQSSNKQHIENEIASLEARLAEKKLALGAQETFSPREIVREAVKERMNGVAPQKITQVFQKKETAVGVPAISHEKLMGQPADRQVSALVTVAMEQGIDHAVTIAKNINDPYVLDLLHDELTTIFFEELVKRNKLEIE